MARRWPLAFCVVVMSACAGNQPAGGPRAGGGLSLGQAEKLVSAFERKQAEATATDPLRQSNSIDQGLEILKRDQIDLFGAGVNVAAGQPGIEAEALHAQLELAWGAGQDLLVYILRNLDRMIGAATEQLMAEQQQGEASRQMKSQLATLSRAVKDVGMITEALALVSEIHIDKGAALAEKIIAKYPAHYVGYRVAADYHRARGHWEEFTRMVAKIEKTKPDSNGLVYLRGVAAAERDGDPEAAAELFRKALDTDPQFVRAQAHLLLVQTSIDSTHTELTRLEALNPRHQIVTWTGPLISAFYKVWGNREPKPGEGAEVPAPTNEAGAPASEPAPAAAEADAPAP